MTKIGLKNTRRKSGRHRHDKPSTTELAKAPARKRVRLQFQHQSGSGDQKSPSGRNGYNTSNKRDFGERTRIFTRRDCADRKMNTESETGGPSRERPTANTRIKNLAQRILASYPSQGRRPSRKVNHEATERSAKKLLRAAG